MQGSVSVDEVTIAAGSAGDTAELARLHRDTVLFAYADIFPPDAARPTLEEIEADWRAALSAPETQVMVAATGDRRIVGSVRLAFYERHGWTLVRGHTLDRPGMPREIRYRCQLRREHPYEPNAGLP